MGLDDGQGPDWFRAWHGGWEEAQRRRNRAPGTIRTYSVYIGDFGSWLRQENVVRPELLVREHLHGWQDALRVRLLPASQQTAVSAVRSFLKWADRGELLPRAGLWMWLDTPFVPEAVPRPLEPHELAKITAHYARPTRDLVRLRDRALFWFLVTTGARISEALQVNRDQVLDRMVVRKKGGSEHVLVMSDLARRWVSEYLAARGRDPVPGLWINLGRRGRTRLRPEQANAIWTELAQQLGLKRFTSHVLKHTGVTELGDDTESDDAIAKHVGWRNTAMMRRYRQLRDRRRQALVDGLDDLVPDPPSTPPPRRPRRFRVVRPA